MDVDSDQHQGSHQPTTPLPPPPPPPPPPPQNEDDNMELYADPRFDSDYNACPSSSSASDAQNTPLPPPTFDEYEGLQYPVVRSSPQQPYEGQTDDEEEDLTLQSALYPGSEFEQPPDDRVEDEQMSVAPTSPGSGGLFVRDENEMGNFEAALAWEDDGGEQSEMKRDEDEQEQERLDEVEQSSVAPSSAIPPSASTGGLFVSDALKWENEDDADDDDEEMEDQ
ncbi:hypothetical protein J4E91_007347 [Alternaria rosae]|nr:hypothetical protein J4E91_007347 [Alternaria rosae]